MIFKGLFSTVGRIFGTDKAAESLINNVSSGLDKLVYTDEEKADKHAADVSEARKMILGWLSATSGQNLARRVLALLVAGVWTGFYAASAAVAVAAIWASDPTIVEKLAETGKVFSDRAGQMNGAMMLILGFYFAAPHLNQIVGVAMNKFSKQGG